MGFITARVKRHRWHKVNKNNNNINNNSNNNDDNITIKYNYKIIK